MASTNYFSHATAAARYAKYRPYFHPRLMERLVQFTGCARFAHALDVACGTGNSTRALAAVAEKVTAVDASAAMLAQAPALPNVVYQEAAAEALPFADSTFELLTVGLAFHWFEQDTFMREAHRVLAPGGWLFVYNNLFMGALRGCPEFKIWMDEVYLKKYLTPPRTRKKLTPEYSEKFGFARVGLENFPNEVSVTREQLVGYFLTQSNVIAAVEQGSERIDDVATWIDRSVAPFFTEPTRAMQFGSDLWFLRKRG
ncbi:MAG TPA: class I SAM-dependent methyltransferase [Opitutales bacterium]|nr:class I SAM-dependent methyltransferase [Opitutales bacterium]